ncbi:MAG: hypothetical protein IV090_19965 [Candidatus Sericytochromatia bacterium]|nr:hypothetical protein [Candidatus Sericytochromatia bacterium]
MSQSSEGVNPGSSHIHLPIALETLPEEWLSQQAELRVAWERLAEMAVPERSAYWDTQLQACIARQRADLIAAYAQSWHAHQRALLMLGLQESVFLNLAGIQTTLDQMQSIQLALLHLKVTFEELYQTLPLPILTATTLCLKKFWQNQARLSDSLKMNNETAFKMALQAEISWRTELMQTEGFHLLEKSALFQLSQISADTLSYYFVLRSLLTHRQRRLESGQNITGTDLKELRKVNRDVGSEWEPEGAIQPEKAWKLSLIAKAEGYEVLNQWGLSLSQLNRGYLDYLKTGFYWLEQSAEQQFSQPEQLLQATESFYKALSVNAYSYESYWALACICFLTGLSEQALAFLEKAVYETRDPGLRGLQAVLDLHA